jgi:hypothetical protein
VPPYRVVLVQGRNAGWETDESNFSVVVMAIRSDELRFTNGMTGLKSNSAEARQGSSDQ